MVVSLVSTVLFVLERRWRRRRRRLLIGAVALSTCSSTCAARYGFGSIMQVCSKVIQRDKPSLVVQYLFG